MVTETQYDIIDDTVGKFGLWQLWICAIIVISKFPSAFYQGSIVFLNPKMDYTCLDPVENDKSKVCAVKCNKYEFDRHIFKETIGTEFELVCDRQYLGALAHTIFMLGNGFGNVIAGVLADKYGRKWIFFSYVVVHFVAVIGIVFAPDLILFLIFRFISGFGTGGLGIGYVIILESIGGKYREVISCLYLLTFPLGLMILSVIAYFIRSWRPLYSVLGSISLVILVLTICVPESARYLLSRKKIDECVEILESGARQNRLPTDKIREKVEKVAAASVEISETKGRGSLGTLVGHKVLRWPLFISIYIFFSASVIFFGILQYIGTLDDNIFLSNFFGALSGIPGLFTCMILTKFCPRKIILAISCALITIGMLLVINFGKSKISVGSAALSLYGLSILVPTMTIFIAEYFPTVVRSTAVGLSFSLSNFGGAVSSFPPLLSIYGMWIPPLIFAILSSISIILLLLIPETKGKPLPQTVEDVSK